ERGDLELEPLPEHEHGAVALAHALDAREHGTHLLGEPVGGHVPDLVPRCGGTRALEQHVAHGAADEPRRVTVAGEPRERELQPLRPGVGAQLRLRATARPLGREAREPRQHRKLLVFASAVTVLALWANAVLAHGLLNRSLATDSLAAVPDSSRALATDSLAAMPDSSRALATDSLAAPAGRPSAPDSIV